SLSPVSHHLALHSFPTRRSSDLISQSPFWNSCYEALLIGQSAVLWIFMFYTFAGDALKILVTSIAAEIYTVTLNGIVLAMVNYRSEEHTSELQSRFDIVCRLLLE